MSAHFEDRMRSWWAEAAAEREPSRRADPREFAIELDSVRTLFTDYTAAANRWTAREN